MGVARKVKNELSLRLYVAGNAPNSLQAITNAKAMCERHFAARYRLEIVDMLNEPRRALADGVIVTPTLLKLSPLPALRMIGNLNDTERLLASLGNK